MATGRPFRTFLESLLKLTRFGNLVIIGLAQYCTAGFLIATTTLNDGSLFILATSTVLIAAAGYIINDYYDVKIDYINKPSRVVIGKSITRRYAILFHVVLSSAGVLLGLLLSWKIGAVNLVTVFLLWFYSNNLKRLPFIGNFVVAFLTGLAIFIVDLYYHTGSALIIIYASFAFFMTLVREIIKDMEDLKGDVTFGCKTLPIMLGLRRTKFVIYLILFLFSATVVILNYFYQVLPLQYYVIFLFVPLLWLLYRLIRADTIRDFARLSAFCKVIMLMGILSMSLH
ncbi:geranylgeranylglycerol-phosphate geranylgeranyltransferase [Parachryseolinea silvisoli]|uniref:geranylgeranylglycerol-phosphate geranylgeranyltransferase n=1 Tax=Parachryseolinea silvisoli TaxID=2873601 RepID=UPI0022658A0B|nr:geranylgeranylglycerol-phosphate geranylgeranyltransferase [Parachryseolinea silvisoli]MCD9016063.1 geranylgeranylglycerol-phosphate geranylgeranyltransferase [Parachryseolinea silvisoli]